MKLRISDIYFMQKSIVHEDVRSITAQYSWRIQYQLVTPAIPKYIAIPCFEPELS